MAKKYDVVIVGAGPAGFMAARTAGENGLNVALLEKKKDLTVFNRSCAQTLVSATEPYLGKLAVLNSRDHRIALSPDGFSVKYDGPHKNLYAWWFYSPAGHPIKLGLPEEGRKIGDLARLGIVIDKESLFRNFLDDVKAVSVDIFPGINVERVTGSAEGVKVEGSGRTFEGTYCIAADGVNSGISEMLGMNEHRYYWCNLNIVSYYMSGVDVPDPNMIITSSGYREDGRCLFFMAPRPFEGEYNVQLLSIDPRVNLKKAAEYFMKETFTAPWFKNAKTLRTLSYVCSCYDPIEVPFKDNILLIGDSASTQEIENTGAMLCGWKAGNAVAAAVRERNIKLRVQGIQTYLDWWKTAFCEGYDHEAYMKNWILTFVLTSAEKMAFAFGLLDEPLPGNFNPYTAGKIMGAKMATLTPIIAQERPDIWMDLVRLRWPLKEVYAEVTRLSRAISDGPVAPRKRSPSEAGATRDAWVKSLGRFLREKK